MSKPTRIRVEVTRTYKVRVLSPHNLLCCAVYHIQAVRPTRAANRAVLQAVADNALIYGETEAPCHVTYKDVRGKVRDCGVHTGKIFNLKKYEE